jgi:hypothetical protein
MTEGNEHKANEEGAGHRVAVHIVGEGVVRIGFAVVAGPTDPTAAVDKLVVDVMPVRMAVVLEVGHTVVVGPDKMIEDMVKTFGLVVEGQACCIRTGLEDMVMMSRVMVA